VTNLSITINGRAHGPTDVSDDLSMNDFLREYLGMTGTKFGCGAAQCLSCAVIIDNPDGTSYTSPTCVVSATSFDGKAIRTVEGHARNGELSVLQKAFIEHFAFQCGYCTSGQIMAGVACIAEGHAGSPQEIRDWMSGNLCRCGAYDHIVAAIQDAAAAAGSSRGG